VAGGGALAGAKVAVGYVAPATVPSYAANVITTPETGKDAGTVEVWNPADLGTDVGHMAMTVSQGATAAQATPKPMVSFRPFGQEKGAVEVMANYLSQLGQPGVPVVATWRSPHRVAFSAIAQDNKVSTQVRDI